MSAYKLLLMHGIKPSLQRMAIMDYLLEHYTHPTADEIYTALSPSMPTLSKTTIYNTLKLFSEQGVVQMLTIDEKNLCFDGNLSPHAHFLCKNCGKIYDVMNREEFGQETKEIANAPGYKITEIHHYYKGICKNCL